MRLALTFLFSAVLAAPASAGVGTADVDDNGRGAYVSDATTLVTVDADGKSGDPVDFGARLALDVSDTGRLAVVAPIDATTLGVGVGTTSNPPTELKPFATAEQPIGKGYRVAIGRDGRLLVAWSEVAQDGSNRVVAGRLAPGADAPELSELAAYDAVDGGYPAGYSVVTVALDNGARPAVALERSDPTGPYAYFRRAESPDGVFGKPRPGISAGRYTRAPLTIFEGTGFTSLFAYGINTSNGPDTVVYRRVPSAKGAGRRFETLALLTGASHWSAAIGANGAGVVAWRSQKAIRVRTRTEEGEWDAKRQTVVRGVDSGHPAVVVSKLGRKLLAFPTAGGIVTSTAGPGGAFSEPRPLAGADDCDRVRLVGSGSGRALAVLRCGDETRLAAISTAAR